MKEKKNFLDTEAWKWIRTLIEILLIAAAVCGVIAIWQAVNPAAAEELDGQAYRTAYAICTKGDHVNVRPFPNTKHEPSGRLEPGDMVYLDGKKRNGYVHVVGIPTEAGEGWVHKGYLVEDPPELADRDATIVCKGKLAARKNVNGKRTGWLKPGGVVHVWYVSDEWCSTNCGYIRTRFLQLDGEQAG